MDMSAVFLLTEVFVQAYQVSIRYFYCDLVINTIQLEHACHVCTFMLLHTFGWLGGYMGRDEVMGEMHK